MPSPANTLTPQSVIPLSTAGQPGSFAPPPFLVPTPQFIAPQTAPPSIINYVSGPNGPAFPPNFQGYQGYNPSVQVLMSIYLISYKIVFTVYIIGL